MAGTISFGGLVSQLDTKKLIESLMAIERRPVTLLGNKRSQEQTRLSAFQTLNTKLLSLKTRADNLKDTTGFFAKTASVSDQTKVSATATNSATAANYTIGSHSVAGKIQLASAEKEVHSGVASSTTGVNSSGSDKVFQYTYAGTQRTLTVTTGTTLEGLRDLINTDASNPGVTASILNDGSSYKLVLTGKDTGATKTITIDAGTTLDGVGGTTVDFRSGTFTQTQTANDAKFKVDGIDITRSSNTITDVISGVTFNLIAETTTSVTLTVSDDTSKIKSNVQSFVSAFNDIVSYIKSQSTVDTKDSSKNGPFVGDTAVRGFQDKLKKILTSAVSGLTSEPNALTDIGITTQTDGTLKIDETKLSDAINNNLQGVSKIFIDAGTTLGVAKQISDELKNVTDSISGPIAVKQKGINDRIKLIDDRITQLERGLKQKEDMLIKQFAALEQLVNSLQSQGNVLNLWLLSLTKSSATATKK